MGGPGVTGEDHPGSRPAANPTALAAIVWDMDGTLVYFKLDSAGSRLAVKEYLEEAGYPPGRFDVRTSILEQVALARDHFARVGYSRGRVEAIFRAVNEIVESYEMAAARVTTRVPGIPAVLAQFRAWGLQQAVWTLNHTRIAEFTLDRVSLRDYFAFVVGRDLTARHKPDPGHLHDVLTRLGVANPRRALVIGDHPLDMVSGNEVGAHTLALVTPRHGIEEFQHAEYRLARAEIPHLPARVREWFPAS